ncbi:MAG: MBL fold metallo-hydrolase [Opitutaceae bacterium]|nr:MBL fold metallo-hydrolase [Opitutaceae bacterium]
MKTPLLWFAVLASFAPAALAQIDTVQTIAPGVYFHQGDLRRGHSNNGWIVFADYVLVVEANFPSGAKVVLPKIRETSDKPVRFAFNTHHHGDHAYGGKVFADAGATLVATESALEEMKKAETGFYGGAPGRWEGAAKNRPDVAESKLKPPSLVFPRELVFDDGQRRVELKWLGIAHTKGDGFVWLPKEKILFTGDACVNGPHNYMGDATVSEWIKTLDAARKLGAQTVVPGHGPIGGPEVLVDQQQYFVELTRRLQALIAAKKSPADVKAALPALATELKAIANIARFVPASLLNQAEKIHVELGGAAFPR